MHPEHRTQKKTQVSADDCLPSDMAEVCDELYMRIDSHKGLDPKFVEELNRINKILRPQIREHLQNVRKYLIEREKYKPIKGAQNFDFDLTEGLV